MGLLGYLGGKLFDDSSSNTSNETGFSTFKFVAVAGSVSLVLFGLGYTFYGLGSALRPVSDMIDYSDSNSDSSSDSSDENSESSDTETISDVSNSI